MVHHHVLVLVAFGLAHLLDLLLDERQHDVLGGVPLS